MGARGGNRNCDDHCTSKIIIVHLYGIKVPIMLKSDNLDFLPAEQLIWIWVTWL